MTIRPFSPISLFVGLGSLFLILLLFNSLDYEQTLYQRLEEVEHGTVYNYELPRLALVVGRLKYLRALTIQLEGDEPLSPAVAKLGQKRLEIIGQGGQNDLSALKAVSKLHHLSIKQVKGPYEQALQHLTELKTLVLQQGNLTDLPHTLQQFKDLKYLEVSHQALGNLSVQLHWAALEQLTYLDLSHNALQTVPGVLFEPPQLTHLFLQDNKIKTVSPNDSLRQTQLKTLDLSNNALEMVPEVVANAPTLKQLSLAYNDLTHLPENLDWEDLKELVVHHNQLDQLPEALVKCFFLEVLDAEHNALRHIPTGLAQLIFLRYLNLSNNPLEDLSLVPLHGMDLRYLNLNETNLQTLHATIWALPNLRVVTLGGTKVVVPKEQKYLIRPREYEHSTKAWKQMPSYKLRNLYPRLMDR